MQKNFTTEEVAEKYGVKVETVWSWVRSGFIKATRTPLRRGRPYSIKASDLEKFEKERRLSHVSEVTSD